MSDVLIMVAPNGARKTKDDHPSLPITPDEVVVTARASLEAGASAIHLHARDGQGRHTLDPEIYQTFIDATQQAVGNDMVVQITTEAVGIYNADQQMASIRSLKPAAATFAVRELFPDDGDEDRAHRFFTEIAEWGCSPQFILYDQADAYRFADLVGHGVIPQKNPFAIFVLGRYLKPRHELEPEDFSNAKDICGFLHDWPDSWPWMVCAFGAAETKVLAATVAMGGHVRIGFENNHFNANGEVAESNEARVACFGRITKALGETPMAYSETKKVFECAAEV